MPERYYCWANSSVGNATAKSAQQRCAPRWRRSRRWEPHCGQSGPAPRSRERHRPQAQGSSQRVAELAASGMSNHDIAAALFISSKTVEANLTRIYRKLAIRSRAQLSAHLNHGADTDKG
jgi:DNA-binding NarL/FixJ family response regulator